MIEKLENIYIVQVNNAGIHGLITDPDAFVRATELAGGWVITFIYSSLLCA